jgi:hypothetical protein
MKSVRVPTQFIVAEEFRFENRSRNHSSMVDSAMPLSMAVW